MMIVWVIVAYNSMRSAMDLALAVRGQDRDARIVIGCNGPDDWSEESDRAARAASVELIKPESNLGYTGFLNSVLQEISMESTIILSNADLELDPHFMAEVRNSIERFPGTAILAPSVINATGRDQNPNLLSMPSSWKLLILTALHRFPVAADLVRLRRDGQSSRPISGTNGQRIYAGHGSCMVFTPLYRQLGGSHDYPCFLFGEEIWYGSEVERVGGEVRYAPNIKALHREHETTGQKRRGFVARAKYESLLYWLRIALSQQLRGNLRRSSSNGDAERGFL